MKQLHDRYVELIRSGPSGLFSRADLARLDAHAADGAAGAELLRRLGVQSVVDIGSGGGVPGIPVAIELDDVDVHLVESQQWKAEFLLTCARALDLESRVTVHPVRVEEALATIPRESVDCGIARALATPIVVAEYLAPLVRVGGHLVLWSTESQAAFPAVAPNEELGLGAPDVVPMVSPLREHGVLVVWPKVSPCAARFPRRTGVAARKPLVADPRPT